MRCACIDIGTNTTRLLVVEGDERGGLRVLAQERAFNALPADGTIGPGATARVAEAVRAQAERMRALGAQRVRVVATGAIRDARDRDAALVALREAAGTEVEVLGGDQEAALAFAGAIGATDERPAGTVAVVDVGGGSTEVAFGTAAAGATWTASMPVGSATLTDRVLAGDPPSAVELDRARAEAEAAWEALGELPDAQLALAVGGSAASLPRLAGEELDPATVAAAIARLVEGPAVQVAERQLLDARRTRLLPAGLLILEAGARRLRLALRVGRGGLREGVVLELLQSG
jgi:exopolyphosphatase/guanosine-5'-triphosphate,3'-diphosphate pyrophosphatase